ncbi:hypothetical protein F8G34_07895 [Vibrio parahaemolyticus]|nr:hypothetical protein [Vibrio parahaemolyticus]WCZ02771.1 hypothetical protein GSS61_00015 [Vibrio parahaemolyticus]
MVKDFQNLKFNNTAENWWVAGTKCHQKRLTSE